MVTDQISIRVLHKKKAPVPSFTISIGSIHFTSGLGLPLKRLIRDFPSPLKDFLNVFHSRMDSSCRWLGQSTSRLSLGCSTPPFPSSACYLLCAPNVRQFTVENCYKQPRCFGLLVRCLTLCFTSSCQLSDKEHKANSMHLLVVYGIVRYRSKVCSIYFPVFRTTPTGGFWVDIERKQMDV